MVENYIDGVRETESGGYGKVLAEISQFLSQEGGGGGGGGDHDKSGV